MLYKKKMGFITVSAFGDTQCWRVSWYSSHFPSFVYKFLHKIYIGNVIFLIMKTIIKMKHLHFTVWNLYVLSDIVRFKKKENILSDLKQQIYEKKYLYIKQIYNCSILLKREKHWIFLYEEGSTRTSFRYHTKYFINIYCSDLF